MSNEVTWEEIPLPFAPPVDVDELINDNIAMRNTIEAVRDWYENHFDEPHTPWKDLQEILLNDSLRFDPPTRTD